MLQYQKIPCKSLAPGVLNQAIEDAVKLAEADSQVRFITIRQGAARITHENPGRHRVDLVEVHPDGIVYALTFRDGAYHRASVTYGDAGPIIKHSEA